MSNQTDAITWVKRGKKYEGRAGDHGFVIREDRGRWTGCVTFARFRCLGTRGGNAASAPRQSDDIRDR